MHRFSTPILFIIFNRPETTREVYKEIRKIRPSKLYVVADGPRPAVMSEDKKCAETRSILENIDWDCEVIKNYSDINLGCRQRVSSGIDWFFSMEEQGIILEDDCLPDESFFKFCEEMLNKYKDDERVGMVSGNNFQFGKVKNQYSYYFSFFSHIWGWATWRRAWQKYDVNMSSWPKVKEQNVLSHIFSSWRDRYYWTVIFNDVYNKKIDTWDYQWSYTCFIHKFLSIMPSENLISNIGFNGIDSTHTKRINKFSNMARGRLIFPLSCPPQVIRSIESDNITQRDNYPFVRYFISRLYKRLFHKR